MTPRRRLLLSGVWTPKRIPGLKLWLDASKIAGLNAGDPVTQWDDLSGNDWHFPQATTAAKPTYRTGIQNNRPGIEFDGVDDFLSNTTITLPQPRTFIIVGRYTGGATDLRNLLDGTSIDTNTVRHNSINADEFTINAGSVINNIVSDDTLPFIWTVIFNGANSLNRWNGDDAAGDVGSRNPTGIRLGMAGDPYTRHWKGFVHEVLGVCLT